MTDPRPLQVKVKRVPGQPDGKLTITIGLEWDPADREAREEAFERLAAVFAAVVPPEDRQQVLDEFRAAAVLAVVGGEAEEQAARREAFVRRAIDQ